MGLQRGKGAGGGPERLRDQDRVGTPGCRRVDEVLVARAGRRRRPTRAEWARQAPQEQRRVGAERGGAGGGVAVRYRVLTDPGTALPGFLVDLANQSSVPDVMRAFNARATSGVYEREDAAAAAARTSAGSGSSRFLAGLVSGERRQGARGAAPVGGLREDHDVAVGAAAKDGDRVGREGWRSEERKRRVVTKR